MLDIWEQVRVDYITDDAATYRSLATKYNVSLSAITHHAKTEKWIEMRQQSQNKRRTRKIRTAENLDVNRFKRIVRTGDKLLREIDRLIKEGNLTAKDIRSLAGALQAIKNAQGAASERELREAEARIKALEKAANSEDGPGKIEVVLSDEVNEAI